MGGCPLGGVSALPGHPPIAGTWTSSSFADAAVLARSMWDTDPRVGTSPRESGASLEEPYYRQSACGPQRTVSQPTGFATLAPLLWGMSRVLRLHRLPIESDPTPKRIALFTGNHNLIADGVSLTLNRLVEYLERRGHAVLVVGPTTKHPPIAHAGKLVAVPSVPIPGRSEYRITLGFPLAARRELTAFAPTLFHVATPDILGNRALRLALRRRIPVVASYHTHFCSYLRYYGVEELEGYLWKYLRRFYRQCRHIYVPSHSMAAVLRAHEITGGLRLWERGVDTRMFNPGRRSLEWRRAKGIADHEVVVAYVGRMVWEKGLKLLMNVFARLSALGMPVRTMIVGDGPVRSAAVRHLPDAIFTGHLTGVALARAYASSDVFFFPSDTETFGNVTLEAMASGLACVCADAPGSNSLVVDDRTGYLAEPGSPSAFLELVSRLTLNPPLRRRIARAALLYASRYDWDATLGRLVSYYDEILNPRPEPEIATARVQTQFA